jgi:hypothetical protein
VEILQEQREVERSTDGSGRSDGRERRETSSVTKIQKIGQLRLTPIIIIPAMAFTNY